MGRLGPLGTFVGLPSIVGSGDPVWAARLGLDNRTAFVFCSLRGELLFDGF